MSTENSHWLLLVVTLPTNSATARMRIWRALKSLGCGALRDGVYLLPHCTAHAQQLGDLSNETVREGGNAYLLTVQAQTDAESDAYKKLFDRSADYAEFSVVLSDARKSITTGTAQEINKVLRKLRRDYDAIRSIDYFPGDATRHAEAIWMDFVNAAEAILSPGEPQSIDTLITKLDPRSYQGRIWVTRRRLWVDRVASAWLIRRFIDSDAKFQWLASPGECPVDALGFDFDGAAFTHIGDRVTFEVLVASFGLEQDRGLARLGAMVRVLDIGSGFVPEANGFEAMLAGARQRTTGDDQLLDEIGGVLDSLYAHFSNDPPTTPAQP
ncbi:MAG TPA: chromate resistance protein ChrB domain-containing protein [Burkholderiaceae bacterium]|jgi:hypothetical protein